MSSYYIDTEFNGFGGALLSMAIIPHDGTDAGVYWRVPEPDGPLDPWVHDNVWPRIAQTPDHVLTFIEPSAGWGELIAGYFAARSDRAPHIIADWPDDIAHLCAALVTAPGRMVAIPGLSFEVKRIDAYPSDVRGAVRHNAWWDAFALRAKILSI